MYIGRVRQHPALIHGMVSGGGNSGHEAVSLAYHLGAAEIVLVGFDMIAGDDGRQHYHGDHKQLTNPGPNLYKQWVRNMHELAASIEARGVPVMNATARSALTLPRYDLPIKSVNHLCQKRLLIGVGNTRHVYQHPDNPLWVVKKDVHAASNEREWRAWCAIKDTRYEHLFAPCVELTDDGLLIMMRCDPVLKEPKRKTVVCRVVVSDSHRAANLGVYNGRQVIVDYGHPDIEKLIQAIAHDNN